MSGSQPRTLRGRDGRPLSAASGREPLNAERAEPCWYCKRFIEINDPIYMIMHGRYGCDTCGHDPVLFARSAPPAAGSKRDAPGYSVKCPTCGVDPGDLCRTTGDKKRPLHPNRKALV